jgi:dTDP-4-dehydrorhamnose 3,5-epimerase
VKFTPTEIPEVILIEPRVLRDERGFFLESYRRDLFAKNGILVDFVQDNHASSKKGALRGLHFQKAPKAQAKLIQVVRGEIFDVAVDIRKGPTFGKHVGRRLSADRKEILFIPAGFAHGYLTLSDEAEVFYKASDFYSPEHEGALLWNDPALRIDWPGKPAFLSEKDKNALLLKDLK